MSDQQHDCQQGSTTGVMVARGDFIAVAAAVSLLCGAILPIPPLLLDIAWGFGLCLSAALILISLTGRDPLDLSGFPPLMIFGVLFRIGLGAATAGMVFRGRIAGTMIETLGDPLTALGSVVILLLMPAVAGAFAALVFRSSGRITAAALTCLTQTIPAQEDAVQQDENAGLLSPRTAEEQRDRLLKQTAFYLNMGRAAKLLRCDIVIAAAAVLAISVGQLVLSSIRGVMNGQSLHHYAAAAAGAGVLVLLPSFIVAAAAARLVARSCNCLRPAARTAPRRRGEVIEIISQETGRPEEIELLNPDFVEFSACAGPAQKENVTDFQAAAAEDCYEALAAAIAEAAHDEAPVLLAAQTADLLPVTVAINVGIRLAQQGLSTLLLDAESSREAVAAVFDTDVDCMQSGPAATCVQGLHVWGLRAASADPQDLPSVLRSAADKHDRLIIYAPDLLNQPHRNAIAAVAAAAIIFTNEENDAQDLTSFLQNAGCTNVETVNTLPTEPGGSPEHV